MNLSGRFQGVLHSHPNKKILGYKCETSFVKGLEYNLLKEYKDKNGVVPPLNIFIK